MSTSYVSADLRRLVVARADRLCEYCLIHEDDTFMGCEVDHIVSEKHGGLTMAENLAFACLTCNRSKGSDVATIIPNTGKLVRFFNPRIDGWHEHFRLANEDGVSIISLTDIGAGTERIFGFNIPDRLQERHALRQVGRYPVASAQRRMTAFDKSSQSIPE